MTTPRSAGVVAERPAATTKEEDFVERLFVANTHDTVLFFSSRGKVYWVRVYELAARGPHRSSASPW